MHIGPEQYAASTGENRNDDSRLRRVAIPAQRQPLLGAVRLQKTRENRTRPQEVREGAEIHCRYEAIGKAEKRRNRARRCLADGIFP